MTRWLMLASALLGGMGCAYGQSARSVVVGSCNSVIQNVTIAEGATQIVEVDCLPDDPAKSFNVRYIWLDARHASFAISEYFDENLKRVFGTPKVLKTPVHATAAEIISKFGHAPNASTTLFGSKTKSSVLGQKNSTETAESELGKLPAAILRRLRIYAAEDTLPWPDLAASTIVKDRPHWPPNYSIVYGDNVLLNYPTAKGWERGGMLIACTRLYRMLPKSEYDSYWDRIAAIEGAKIEEIYITSQMLRGGFKETAIGNLTYDAIGYFTQHNWPEDFALIFGDFNYRGCGDTTFGFYVRPRELFVQFAVIEARARNLDIAGLTFDVDNSEQLRRNAAPGEELKLPIGQVSLKRGESLLVPLRIELRYSADRISELQENKAAATRVLQLIRNFPDDPLKMIEERYEEGATTPKRRLLMSKLKSSFRAPEILQIAPRYIFGRSLALKRVWISDKEYEVRQAPALAVVSLAVGEEGSCPYVYFRALDGVLSVKGRALIGASAPERRRRDVIDIPEDSASVLIGEQEPEVTYLSEVTLRNRRTGESLELARGVRLRSRQAIELEVPQAFRRDSELVVEGWYRPLLDAVADAEAQERLPR